MMKSQNNSFYNKFRRGVAGLLVGLGLLGMTGCATTGEYATNNSSEIGYEKFFDSYGDYRLVRRNNDVWIEKLDGSESRQITHTPNVKEERADFSKDNNYILYLEYHYRDGEGRDHGKAYRTKRNSDDSTKQEIGGSEYMDLIE